MAWIIASNRDIVDGVTRGLDGFGSCTEFQVPHKLKFGSFDSLVKNVDELTKVDSYVESVLRRLERQVSEMAAEKKKDVDLGVMIPGVGDTFRTLTVQQYLNGFRWEDKMYSRSASVSENAHRLLAAVQGLDEDIKGRTQELADLKNKLTLISKKDGGTLAQKDLIDVLTPDVVGKGDFVDTDHFKTLIVILPRGGDKEFLSCYEKLAPFDPRSDLARQAGFPAVPQSMKQFEVADKEGFTIWRVVVLRKAADDFAHAARLRKAVVRDFPYSVEAYEKILQERCEVAALHDKKFGLLMALCTAAFSDAYIQYVHVKAMRTFVECVLRYGISKAGNTQFKALAFHPGTNKKEETIRQHLAKLMSPQFGEQYFAGKKDDTEEGEFHSYVSLNVTTSFA